MGVFDIFRKKKTRDYKEESKVPLAMPMFNNGETYNLHAVIEHLKHFWGFDISDLDGDNETAAFKIEGESVVLAFANYQIPWDDIKETAPYAYNWMSAEEDLKSHTGHAIVTVMGNTKDPVEKFRILSKLLCSILITSNCIGIYQGSQSLLIPKDQYLDNLEELKEDGVPVMLWVYIGLRKSDSGQSAYTYGLTSFKKQEIEIIDSKLGLEELHDFLSNIASYIIGSNVTLKSGETLGYSEDQKIKIVSSPAKFVPGESLKLKM